MMRVLHVRRRTFVIVSFAAIVSLAQAASASQLITPMSQKRYVEATSEYQKFPPYYTDSDYEDASSLGPFDATVSSSVEGAQSSATQISQITNAGVVGEGEATAWASLFSCFGESTSYCAFTFTLNEAVDFQLTGRVEGHAYDLSTAFFRFTGPDGVILTASAPYGMVVDPVASFSRSGQLAPGQYSILARADASNQMIESYVSSFDFDLTFVPEPSTLALLGVLALAARRR